MGAKSKAVMGVVDALGNKIGALGDYLKEFDPKTFYHYSPEPDIKKFDPKSTNDPFGESASGAPFEGRGATYFTSDQEFANQIMEDIHDFELYKDRPASLKVIQEKLTRNQQAPTIYPVKIKTKDIFDFENPEHLKRISDDPDETGLSGIGYDILKGKYQIFEEKEIQEILKEAGFRGYRTNEPGTVGLFYPDEGDVRSVFAKFDPSKSKKGEILASVPVGALGALGAMENE